MGQWDVVQVCLNGHVTNESARGFAHFNKDFCPQCGCATITDCQQCGASIPGEYVVQGIFTRSVYIVPAFCQFCGAAYPWTQARLSAAKELAHELEDLSENERDVLEKSLDDLVRDTPQTTVAAVRFKRLVAKAGAGVAGAFRDILVDVASETAKKAIWG